MERLGDRRAWKLAATTVGRARQMVDLPKRRLALPCRHPRRVFGLPIPSGPLAAIFFLPNSRCASRAALARACTSRCAEPPPGARPPTPHGAPASAAPLPLLQQGGDRG